MQNYLGHRTIRTRRGIWLGLAARPNVSTAQEIHDAQMKLTLNGAS